MSVISAPSADDTIAMAREHCRWARMAGFSPMDVFAAHRLPYRPRMSWADAERAVERVCRRLRRRAARRAA